MNARYFAHTMLVPSLLLAWAVAAVAEDKPEGLLPVKLDMKKMTKYPSRIYQDTQGEIWGSFGEEGVFHWTGEDWEQTPAHMPAHPRWQAEPNPPWQAWRGGSICTLVGRGGAILVVMVRDIDQDVAAQLGPASDPHKPDERGHRNFQAQLAQHGGVPFWLEGALHVDGQWIGPMPLDDLLKQQFDTLVKQFSLSSSAADFFALQSDGHRLWVAHDGKVEVIARDGLADTWVLPLPPSRVPHPPPGPMWNALLPLADGSMGCSYQPYNERSGTNFSLTWGDGKISPQKIEADLTPGSSATTLHWSKGGQVWCFSTTGMGEGSAFRWDGHAWKQREDLGRFAGEDLRGVMWFLPRRPGIQKPWGYIMVEEDKAEVWPVPFGNPHDLHPGSVTPASGERLTIGFMTDRDLDSNGAGHRLHRPGAGFWLLHRGEKDDAWRVVATYWWDAPAWPDGLIFLDNFGGVVLAGYSAKIREDLSKP